MYSALDYMVDTAKNERCREISEWHKEKSCYNRCKVASRGHGINIHMGNHIIYIDIGSMLFSYKPTTGKVVILNHGLLSHLKHFENVRTPEDVIAVAIQLKEEIHENLSSNQ